MTSAARCGAALLLLCFMAESLLAAPRRKPQHASYDLDILGFNDGSAYQLHGAEAEAVLGDPGVEIFAFATASWLEKDQHGGYVAVRDLIERYPGRRASELVSVYEVDLEGDKSPEMLLVPTPLSISAKHRYAPTLLELGKEGYRAVWSAFELRGESYRVIDIRDLNADSRPELVISGQSGESGFYVYWQLVGRGRSKVRTLPVDNVDSMHYVDLDRDGKIEIVVRKRVGMRGPADQRTYVDHLYRWNGRRFLRSDESYPRYHDEQTLPTLLGDILDNYAAERPILQDKVEAIQKVRAQVLEWTDVPRGFHKKKVKALRNLKRRRYRKARAALSTLDTSYPYDIGVLVGLAEIHADSEEWQQVLDYAIRALTVDPQHRPAWWWAGVAFFGLSERSAALASLHSAVSLCGKRADGVAYLKKRRGEPGMEGALQVVIDQALDELNR